MVPGRTIISRIEKEAYGFGTATCSPLHVPATGPTVSSIFHEPILGRTVSGTLHEPIIGQTARNTTRVPGLRNNAVGATREGADMVASGNSAGNNRTRKRKRNRLRKRSLQIRKLADDCILNDAGVALGDDHLSVLCKGLRFVPNLLPVPPLTEDLTAFNKLEITFL